MKTFFLISKSIVFLIALSSLFTCLYFGMHKDIHLEVFWGVLTLFNYMTFMDMKI